MAAARLRAEWGRSSLLAAVIHNAFFSPPVSPDYYNPFRRDDAAANTMRLTAKEAAAMKLEELI